MSRLALGLALGLAGARGEDCGVAWGNYVLAPSGARDCGGCGEGIESYASCAEASRNGAAFLGVGGLGGRETWDGPPGCHIQEGSNFQWNTNLAGRASPGHTPVCYQAGASPPDDEADGAAAVIIIVVVVVSVVVCCAVVGAVVFCAYHRRQAVQSMAPYYGSQPFYESQPPVLPPATTELVVVHGHLVEPAPAAGPAVLPGTFAK